MAPFTIHLAFRQEVQVLKFLSLQADAINADVKRIG
jgi:hypothetical protein